MDLVLFALALEYVDDRASTLRELRRVLRPDGALVLSRQHPTGDWLRHGGSYFDVRVIEEVWSKGRRVRYWLVPLERTCEELHEGGLSHRAATRAAAKAEAADRVRLSAVRAAGSGLVIAERMACGCRRERVVSRTSRR